MPDERTSRSQGALQPERRRATIDVATQIVGRFGNLVLGVFVTVLVARSLGESRFGDWSTLLAILSLTAALCDLGLTPVAVRRAAEDSEAEPRWLGALVQLRLILSTTATVIAVAAVLLISSGTQMMVAGIVLVSTLLLSAPSAVGAIFQLRVRNALTVAMQTLQSVLWAAGTVVVLATGSGMIGLAIAYGVVAVVVTSVQLVVALRLGSVSFAGARKSWGDLLRVGIPVAVTSALVLGYGRIDQVLVRQLGGSRDAGLYAAVYRIFDQSQFVAVSVATTVFPLLAVSFRTDVRRFRGIMQDATELMLVFSIGGFIVSLVYPHQIVSLLFGAGYADAAPALPVLVGTLIPVSIGYMTGMLVILTDNQLRYVAVAAVGLTFNVVANVLAIPVWGFIAAAWITLATELLVVALGWAMVRRRLPAQLAVGRLPRIAVAAGLLAGVLQALELLSTPVLLAVPLAAAVYAGALVGFRAVAIAELKGLIRRA